MIGPPERRAQLQTAVPDAPVPARNGHAAHALLMPRALAPAPPTRAPRRLPAPPAGERPERLFPVFERGLVPRL